MCGGQAARTGGGLGRMKILQMFLSSDAGNPSVFNERKIKTKTGSFDDGNGMFLPSQKVNRHKLPRKSKSLMNNGLEK